MTESCIFYGDNHMYLAKTLGRPTWMEYGLILTGCVMSTVGGELADFELEYYGYDYDDSGHYKMEIDIKWSLCDEWKRRGYGKLGLEHVMIERGWLGDVLNEILSKAAAAMRDREVFQQDIYLGMDAYVNVIWGSDPEIIFISLTSCRFSPSAPKPAETESTWNATLKHHNVTTARELAKIMSNDGDARPLLDGSEGTWYMAMKLPVDFHTMTPDEEMLDRFGAFDRDMHRCDEKILNMTIRTLPDGTAEYRCAEGSFTAPLDATPVEIGRMASDRFACRWTGCPISYSIRRMKD